MGTLGTQGYTGVRRGTVYIQGYVHRGAQGYIGVHMDTQDYTGALSDCTVNTQSERLPLTTARLAIFWLSLSASEASFRSNKWYRLTAKNRLKLTA